MSSLLEMTDIPMTNILEKCGFKSVLTLRKVCHSLRNFIDDSGFKTDLDNIEITIGPNGFSGICQNLNAYWGDGTGCDKDWTSNDLKIILKLIQNTKLSSFYVRANQDNFGGLDDLEEILKNQTRPLQTKSFAMKGTEILKVLPYLDSKLLKRITIIPENYQIRNQNLVGLEQFLELEQFKNAMELIIDSCFLVRADLRKLFHFQEIRVRLHETSMEELVALKEAFVTSTHMVYFFLFSHKLNKNQLAQLFGTPFPNQYCGWQWFFKIRNCKEHVLRIEWGLSGLKFRKLEANEVPQDAVVQH
ncbi:unnamed protein product [Caenorhabditis brenneri]